MLLGERPQDVVVRPALQGAALLCAASLALAALTLLFPSAPTYDPWAWVVWGREIAHLDLSTVDGPSWKPLPVLFTTPFSLFGSAAPDLWLVVARAGTIAAIALAFRVGRRLGGPVAGGAAAGALLLAPWLLRNAGLGNSEGLLAALMLGAIDRELAGRRGAAFGLGVAAALVRPETWPFLGLYALWIVWRDRTRLKQVALGLSVVPLLWFLPELWGSGNLLRAASRARNPRADSPAFDDEPISQVLSNAGHMLTVPVWIGIGAALVALVARRVDRERARPVLVLAAMAIAWVGVVAYMTKDGFSGNQRYLVMPVVLTVLVAAAGIGWAVRALGAPRAAMGALMAVAAIAFAVPSMHRLPDVLDTVRYQSALPDQLATAVDAAGGAARLRACGQAYTGPFLVPAVAWQLHVHTTQVGLDPVRPAVVFRVRTNPEDPVAPSLRGLGRGPAQTLARTAAWRIVAACR